MRKTESGDTDVIYFNLTHWGWGTKYRSSRLGLLSDLPDKSSGH